MKSPSHRVRARAQRHRLLALVSTSLTLLAARASHAQDGTVTLDQFRAAELPGDSFGISRPTTGLGNLDVGGALVFDYAMNPLVYEASLGDPNSEAYSVVRHQLVGSANLSLGLGERAAAFLLVPTALVMEGDEPTIAGGPTADGLRVGDPVVGARIGILGDRASRFSLGAQLAMSLPMAHLFDPASHFVGENTVALLPRVMAEVNLGIARLDAQVGGRFRGLQEVTSLDVGQELTYGVGVTLAAVPKRLSFTVQALGATALGRGQTFDREHSPLEALAGLEVHPTSCLAMGAAGGAGLTRGYGSPDARAVLSLTGVAGSCREAAPAPEAPAPVLPPAPAVRGEGDADDDGLLDSRDRCPTAAEDFDAFQDEDGCPDLDNDIDGIEDMADREPNIPEDFDSFEDEDGAPEADNDADGILDSADACPVVAEDIDGIADEDGCPETDADDDSVLDPEDHCPLTPGVANATREECRGCPALACVTEGNIVILQRIEFATNSDVITRRSIPVVEAVAEILVTTPTILRVRVEGHTDDRGPDERNQTLSERRAASVVRWLVEHGVAAERLESAGFGESRPLTTNRGSRGRQTNRRVEFHIVEQTPRPVPR